jgi:ArsR family transcriptional regulator, arsenate/arsenite/antimonite-responsive transcriptional repressor
MSGKIEKYRAAVSRNFLIPAKHLDLIPNPEYHFDRYQNVGVNMDVKQAAKILKALSHPNRLEIYLSIVNGEKDGFKAAQCECSVSELISTLKIGAPTVSHHLKELANAGLITTERQGKFLVARPKLETWDSVKKLLQG